MGSTFQTQTFLKHSAFVARLLSLRNYMPIDTVSHPRRHESFKSSSGALYHFLKTLQVDHIILASLAVLNIFLVW